MQLNTTLSQRLSQQMVLAPRMIQSMEILQLPIMALQERIQQELQENPVLELKETDGDEQATADEEAETPPAPAESADDAEREQELVIDESGDNGLDFDRLEALSRDWEDQYNEEHRHSRNGMDEEGDKKHDAMQNMASRPQSLQDYLNDQLTFIDGTPERIKLLKYIVSNINENGFLTATVEEMATNFPLPVSAAEVEEALQVVQKLDPLGVGARDLKECLLLQLTPETPHRDVVRALIEHHLEDIQHNRLPIIQRRTGFELTVIKAAIEVLKHLNPRPGSRFTADNIPYVVPDIVVERREDGD